MVNYRFYANRQPEGGRFDRVHAMLVTRDQRVLLRYKNGEARVTGGRLEEHEDIEMTLQRELREEVDCEIDRWDYLGYIEARDVESGEQEFFARLVARVSKILPVKPDPDRAGNWIYGRSLVPIEIAHREMDDTFPTNRAVLGRAWEVAQAEDYFTEPPNPEVEIINVESHDELAG